MHAHGQTWPMPLGFSSPLPLSFICNELQARCGFTDQQIAGASRSTVSEQIPSVSVRLCGTQVSEFVSDSLQTRLHSSGPEALMQPRLLIISGSLTGTIRPLIDGNVSIGLDESNQLSLIDTVVSREHCTIEQVDAQYEVVDRDSPSGTFVNGIPVRRKVLD